MLTIRLSVEDLAHIRFAFSALWETVASYRVLRRPEKYPLHLPWIREASEELRGLDLSILETLVFRGGYPDFLTPPPSSALPDFASELHNLRVTPDEIVLQDLRNVQGDPRGIYAADALNHSFEPFLSKPKESLERLSDILWLYWERAMAQHWPRLRTLFEADVMYRARMFALEGPEKVFNALHPGVRYQDRTLKILKESLACPTELELSGRGLLLIPSVFASKTIMFDSPWQETLQYGARGTAGLWSPDPPPSNEALEKLLGQSRARLLKYLITPSTTQELAYVFRISPSAVSQHLSWLREVGLVATQRHGKQVYYKLSTIGENLLESYGELETPLAFAG